MYITCMGVIKPYAYVKKLNPFIIQQQNDKLLLSWTCQSVQVTFAGIIGLHFMNNHIQFIVDCIGLILRGKDLINFNFTQLDIAS